MHLHPASWVSAEVAGVSLTGMPAAPISKGAGEMNIKQPFGTRWFRFLVSQHAI